MLQNALKCSMAVQHDTHAARLRIRVWSPTERKVMLRSRGMTSSLITLYMKRKYERDQMSIDINLNELATEALATFPPLGDDRGTASNYAQIC